MKLVLVLVLIATAATAQGPPCSESQGCREKIFHVTDVEVRDATGEVCYPGYCAATRYEVSGFVKEPGKNAIVYRAECTDSTWLAGKSKGQHWACTVVEAGESYRAEIFQQAIDFSLGNNSLLYQITSQREASGK